MWWTRIYFMSDGKRERFIVKAHGMGAISDWRLWNLLSRYNGPVSHREASHIYLKLGFVPHSGYPLRRRQ